MSPYEVALLVATALFVCILLWDNHKIRGRLERSEADIVWLVATAKNTVEVHQRVMDNHAREINHLNEAHEKFAKRVQYYMNQTPAYGRLAARVDRMLKADATRALYREQQLDKAFEGEIPPGTEQPF